MKNFLKNNFRSSMPLWLAEYDSTIDIAAVPNTRCVYYPGAGFDGQPIHTFNAAHAAYLYIYADYGVEKQVIESKLNSFKGYKVIGKHDIALNKLATAWRPHILMTKELVEESRRRATVAPYCFIAIFERLSDFSDEHGAKRFAVIFIGGDGIATYDALFGNKNMIAPLSVVLQEHGFGGNYASFGRDSIMEEIAKNSGVYPELLLVGTNCTEAWHGFYPVNSPGVLGGMYSEPRQLFCRSCRR
ncbi:MAG: hypothetical protein J6W00_12590 [Lentisphaeria bacterium]|nr:hypothetical protein [Lentisphaeria bacterium]